jgi:peptidoglycan/xylan/chitin deacetylase (PgdA/CDA1 family)
MTGEPKDPAHAREPNRARWEQRAGIHGQHQHRERLRRLPRVIVRRSIARLGPRLEPRSDRLRHALTRGLTIFCFHEISDTPSEYQRGRKIFSSEATFAAQLAWIAERFQLISPKDLPALGGDRNLPEAAALITFDDAWAGAFTHGLPILAAQGVPALYFINTATIDGDPDIGAVRLYERRRDGRSQLDVPLDVDSADDLLIRLRAAYAADDGFLSFQGKTATPADLLPATEAPDVWFGLHLHHHWDTTRISPALLAESLRLNAASLRVYPNVVAAFATPHGRPVTLPAGVDVGAVFLAGGAQNQSSKAAPLDRVVLSPEPADSGEWWYATHRRRLLGRLAELADQRDELAARRSVSRAAIRKSPGV